jgi:two-component system, LytTR family, response regulator
MIKAIIIDDESDARNILKALLNDFCPEVHVISSAPDLEKGIEAIVEYMPDLIFLDIEMPRMKGINILNYLPANTYNFQIIFVTAYQQYAIDAFRLSACDYLLKPIDITLLKEAVTKAQNTIEKNSFKERYRLLSTIMENKMEKICINEKEQTTIIKVDEIVYLKADSNYTEFHLISGQIIVASKTLKEYDGLLKNDKFFKCHRSYIVNMNMISVYLKTECLILLKNKAKIPLSRERKEEFKNIFIYES